MSLLDEDLSVQTDYHVLIKNMHFMGSYENLNDFSKSYKFILNIGAVVLERTTNMFYVYSFNGWVCLKEILENCKLEEYEMNSICGVLCSYFSMMSEIDNYPKNTFTKPKKYIHEYTNI